MTKSVKKQPAVSRTVTSHPISIPKTPLIPAAGTALSIKIQPKSQGSLLARAAPRQAQLLQTASSIPSSSRGTFTNFRTTNWSPKLVLYKPQGDFSALPKPHTLPQSQQSLKSNPSKTGSTLWAAYKTRITDAIHSRKIFLVYGNNFLIRRELLNRGWLEKLPHARFYKLQTLDDETLLKFAHRGNDYESVAISRLLRSYPAYFIWQDKSQIDQCADVHPFRNVIRKSPQFDFSTKIGMMGCAAQEHWYSKPDAMSMSIPRCYKLGGTGEDTNSFIQDYQITQSIGLMTFIRENIKEPFKFHDAERGSIPAWIVNFAVAQLRKYVNYLDNKQLDAKDQTEYTSIEWKQLIGLSSDLIRGRALIKGNFKDIVLLSRSADEYIKRIKEKEPDRRWDGCRNLWILKPGFLCRGNGIVVRYDINDILSFGQNHTHRKYVIQKYIDWTTAANYYLQRGSKMNNRNTGGNMNNNLLPNVAPGLSTGPMTNYIPPNVSRADASNISLDNSNHMLDAPTKNVLWNLFKKVILEAQQNRKIFLIYGSFPTIRQELLNRGWLEKLPPGRFPRIENMDDESIAQFIQDGNQYESVAISRLLKAIPAYFIWQDKSQPDQYIEQKPMRNIIRREYTMDFATKVGLIGCAEQEMWYVRDGVSGMNYPRFYRLSQVKEEHDAFIRDYLLTQCMGLASYVKNYMGEPQLLYDFDNGTVPISVLSFAVGQLKKHCVEMDNDQHIIYDNVDKPHLSSEWKHFLFYSNEILHANSKFKGAFRELLTIARTADVYLKKIYDKNPHQIYDGYKNIWILKPGYQCRGNGIVVRFLLDDILAFITSNPNGRYIAQKYIERPLLVYNTKFDIRQYMLVTISDKLIRIWLYKDSYLKFSGQEFNLDDLNEAIHLTNNTVQRKYKNSRNRDSRLPFSNMWSSDQFKEYLRSQNVLENVWETKIFAGFKRNLIAVVMASMEETFITANSFELYGCDFMLDEGYNPILIEINSAPDMSASTEVTARLCPQVLKDLVKVIVDLPNKPFSSTGQFELVFEQNYKGYTADPKLSVSGHAMHIEPYKMFKGNAPKVKKAEAKPEVKHVKQERSSDDSKSGVVLNRTSGSTKTKVTPSIKRKSPEPSSSSSKKKIDVKNQ